MKITSTNPSTQETLGEVEFSTNEEIVAKVQKARDALKIWKDIGLDGRIKYLRIVIENFEKRSEEFASLISKEMGMPISQSVHDVSGGTNYFKWYLDNAEKYLSPEIIDEDDDSTHTIFHDPVGVVAAITPWNFPCSNFVWMIGQNLVVGNTIVFKDSEEVALCGKLIEEVFKESNLPDGVFSEIYGNGETGDFLVHQNIDMICFTGSTNVGQKLYKVAAEKFIKVFLELGGSAPGIVFSDADLDVAVENIIANRFDNCGQICDGLKRLIVSEDVVDDVIAKLKIFLENAKVGDASLPETFMGPLVSESQKKNLELQVQDALDKGAKIIYQKELDNTLVGNFYPPTILTNITKDMKVWNEEVFGPVLPIATFNKEENAILMANCTKYGLGGYIYTSSNETFRRIADKMESGMVQWNATGYCTPATPFGGIKCSGIGREHGRFGFWDLTNLKLISEGK